MKRFVHRQNIEHYREMLKTITDGAQRKKIIKLLSEEEAALKKAEEESREKRGGVGFRSAKRTCASQLRMSAKGQKAKCEPQTAMSALPPIATAKADIEFVQTEIGISKIEDALRVATHHSRLAYYPSYHYTPFRG